MIRFKTFVELVIDGALSAGVWVKSVGEEEKGYLNRISEKCEERKVSESLPKSTTERLRIP